MNLTPARLQVLMARLAGIADEMGAVLQRAAFSPNIRERADCSAALFTASGELLAQAEHVPVHLGSMPASVAAAIAAFPTLGAGDQVVLNDPFAGGTHINDITLVAPCVIGGELIGWVANRAHHADVGGMTPGSIPPDAIEAVQEGLRLPPVRLTRDVASVLSANSRNPVERSGDLDAQAGANRVGVDRFGALVAIEGTGPLAEVADYGERRMRAALADLSDGAWEFGDVLDSAGGARVVVRVTKERERITFDFTGTEGQRAGNVNAVLAVTVSAVAWALRSVLDPTIPANGGALRPVRVIAPPGTVVSAVPPAAVGAGNVEVSQRVADVCLGALAHALPDRVPAAGQGTMNNLMIGGEGWVYYETLGGGQGGRPPSPRRTARAAMSGVHAAMTDTVPPNTMTRAPMPGQSGIHTGMTNTVQPDTMTRPPMPGQSAIHTGMTNTMQPDTMRRPPMPGQSGIHTGMTNTRNTPIEALERAYPLRVLRYAIRRGSGGAGLAPGGDGIVKDIEVLEDCTVSLVTERRESRPWGLAGGEPGLPGENWLLPKGDDTRAQRLPAKVTVRAKTGDVVRIITPGGGGWGMPQ
jgi:N-methylhydantoinase B/oxoprolinase/acetone carboxylase alpha subunit